MKGDAMSIEQNARVAREAIEAPFQQALWAKASLDSTVRLRAPGTYVAHAESAC